MDMDNIKREVWPECRGTGACHCLHCNEVRDNERKIFIKELSRNKDEPLAEYYLRVNKINSLIEKLQDCKHKNDASGIIGNLIGDLKGVARSLRRPNVVVSKVSQIINEYENDPVIRAYFDAREEWRNKLMEIKDNIAKCFE